MLLLVTKLFSLPEYNLNLLKKKNEGNYVNPLKQDFLKCASVCFPSANILPASSGQSQNLIWNYRATTSVLIQRLLEAAVSGFTLFGSFATSETLGNDRTEHHFSLVLFLCP